MDNLFISKPNADFGTATISQRNKDMANPAEGKQLTYDT